MSRPLRIHYPDALYHVMNRGRRGEEIFTGKNEEPGSALELGQFCLHSRADPVSTIGGVQVARMKGPKTTNRYPDELMIKAVQLADHPDFLVKDVAEDLGVHPILLYRWRKEYREGKFKEDRRKKRAPAEKQR